MPLRTLSKKDLIAIIEYQTSLIEQLEKNSSGGHNSAVSSGKSGSKESQPLLSVVPCNGALSQKLINIEKLEMVSHLAASISHEVRNPLTVVKGFMQLSLDDNLSSADRSSYLNTAIEELDRASEILTDYLSFARTEVDKKEIVIVFKEVQRVINVLTPLANMNNVQISFSFEENKDSFIWIEGGKFGQFLLNIMKNSIEAMPDGGRLHIKLTECITAVQIDIKDEGIGMTEAQINCLGKPYFTTKENGTGLGMLVSFKILNELNGKISVESEVGKGTCWKVVLPFNKQRTN
ncbi:ATP-binding protein [Domibacillus sp. PGB-M46]|uniref:ATP-binding protein n=1 Tax=Domibacillus sp. PGB-M46 TaxID=2910255 RepID=UPI001F568A8C|nr:ATP-binding protein [Domibacillus sp. PGB-M46]MCI2256037.1 ATP-binding protein [Domibacillus sp. PGB-M46]